MGLEDYADDKDTGNVEQTALRKILEVIASKKATYLSEIDKATMLDRDTIKNALYHLKKNKVIEPLSPKLKLSDQRLLDRRVDMHSQGKTGIDQFKQINWYGLNHEFEWILKVKGTNMYVDEYHERIEQPEMEDFKQPHQYAADEIKG